MNKDTKIPGSTEKPEPKVFAIHGWNFRAQNGPILDTQSSDKWSKELSITLPEMVFGESKLEIWNENYGTRFEFNALDALRECKHESDVKVSMAEKWTSKSDVQVPEGHAFDWTYGSLYRGTILAPPPMVAPKPTDERIDFESLKPRSGDEILWSSETALYEDELHDQGTSQMTVRIRVTNNYFYVLQRVWIRVDGVIFRLRETRLHHRFGDHHALRLFTDRDGAHSAVIQACTPKQLKEGILDDPNMISELLTVKKEETEMILLIALEATIQEAPDAAEEAFKKKFGGAKPNAAALLQRQRQHETRYFDSGDAFSGKGKARQAEEKLEPVPAMQLHTTESTSTAPSVEDAARKEMLALNAAADEAFKKKFGGAKPNAAALLQRQRQHETRYFDSGDAFSGKGKGSKEDPPQEQLESVVAVVHRTASASSSEEDGATLKESIAQQNAAADEAFKKKFGGVKPNAAALMQRQRQHETRYFDSGDAFSGKGKGKEASGEAAQKAVDEAPPPPAAVAPVTAESGDAEATARERIARENAAAEEAFKKKFGGAKPNAAALMQRQRQHETRYFDSGDAFSGKSKEAGVEALPTAMAAPAPAPVASPPAVPMQAEGGPVVAAGVQADEIARQNAAAEEAFKKKFGNAKPNAAALMQRQRQHETRYFDSGDAFGGKGK